MSIATRNVCLATAEQSKNRGSGGRVGTVHGLTLAQFAAKFGNPHESESADGKVTAQWFFKTPRGIVAVHDYWWNPSTELSIGDRTGGPGKPFGNRNAARWLKRYLRDMGVIAE